MAGTVTVPLTDLAGNTTNAVITVTVATQTRVALWTSLNNAANYIDPGTLRSWGYTDIVCSGNWLVGNGGAAPASWELGLIGEYHAAGLRIWRAVYFKRTTSQPTQLADWFDDARWAQLLAGFSTHADLSRRYGYDGIAFDEEPPGGQQSWAWNYPGNTRDEATTRAKVQARGVQIMQAIVAKWPGVPILDYFGRLPKSWYWYVQKVVNADPSYDSDVLPVVQPDLWAGMVSVAHGPVSFLDHTFYKGMQAKPRAPYPNTWDGAMQQSADDVHAWMGRRGWNQTGLSVVPFVAISPIEGGTGSNAALPPEQVAGQLAAAKRHTDGAGMFVDYHYGAWPYPGFTYTPYVPV